MSKVIQVTFAGATKTLGKRYIAKSDAHYAVTEYNPDLTDSANERFAANAVVRQMNSEPANITARVRFTIVASGLMPDGKSTVYIAEEI